MSNKSDNAIRNITAYTKALPVATSLGLAIAIQPDGSYSVQAPETGEEVLRAENAEILLSALEARQHLVRTQSIRRTSA